MEIIGKDGEIEPQIHKEWQKLKPEFKSDREIRILRESGEWELSTISEVRVGNRFRIYVISSTGFITGYDNGYVITEYEATSDAYMMGNGAWEIDCLILEKKNDGNNWKRWGDRSTNT